MERIPRVILWRHRGRDTLAIICNVTTGMAWLIHQENKRWKTNKYYFLDCKYSRGHLVWYWAFASRFIDSSTHNACCYSYRVFEWGGGEFFFLGLLQKKGVFFFRPHLKKRNFSNHAGLFSKFLFLVDPTKKNPPPPLQQTRYE